MGRLPRARRAAGNRGRAGDLQQPDDQCARFLRRRDASRLYAGGASRPPRVSRCKRHVPHHDARFRGSRRDRRVRVARIPRHARAGAARGSTRARQRAGQCVCQLEAQRAGLELRRKQLSQGEDAAAFRSPLLEQRLGQSARSDVRLFPPQHVSGQSPARPSCPDDVRRADRCVTHRDAELRVCLARGSHRAVAFRLSHDRARRGRCELRARRFGSYRRRRQPAAKEEAPLLDQRPLDG